MQFLRTQLPFSGAIACLGIFLTIANPSVLQGPRMQGALLITLLATLTALILPLFRAHPRWLIVTPLLDIVVVVLLRRADEASFQTVGFLIIFPVIWLAYAFSRGALAVALVATFGVSIFPFALMLRWPESPQAWAAVTIVPLFVCIMAGSVWVAATSLRRHQRELETVTVQLRDALTDAAERTKRLDAVLNAVQSSIGLFDAHKRPVLWNAAAEALLERGGDTGTNSMALPFVFGADRVTPVPSGDQILARSFRDDLLGSDIFWFGEPGDQRAVIASSRPVYAEDGSSLGLVIVAQDVTELVESISVRDEFLAAVSHELRTPLVSILGYVEQVQEEIVDLESGLRLIQLNSERALTVVVNLMDAAGRPVLTRQQSEIGTIVTAAVERARPLARLSGAEIEWAAEKGQIARVDPAALGHVLDHLLENAVKFGLNSHAARVRVSTASVGETVVIRVVDTGVGMTQDEQRQMFDKFFRAPSARSTDIPGAGLGMAVVKSLVEAHGGTVGVTSKVDVGTIVTVAMPIR